MKFFAGLAHEVEMKISGVWNSAEVEKSRVWGDMHVGRSFVRMWIVKCRVGLAINRRFDILRVM